jgi:hypothetical protein
MPEPTFGTTAVTLELVADVICAARPLMNSRSFDATALICEPVTVSVPPGVTVDGENPVTLGTAVERTVKVPSSEADPAGVVTLSVPLTAPDGTATVILVEVTADGVAAWPPNDTDVLEVVPNAVPYIVMVCPTGALAGDASTTTRVDGGSWVTEVVLPTASY